MTEFHSNGEIYKAGDRVRYKPKGELGTISSINCVGTIFVKYDTQVNHIGWDKATAQATYYRDLEKAVEIN